jgi:uncharacterized protein (TIGR00369 family)
LSEGAKHAAHGVAYAADYHLKVPFARHLGLVVDELEPGVARMSCHLQPHMKNSFGTSHGGVVMTMLDVCMCMAARTLHPGSAGIMTVTMNTSFIGGGTDPMKAEARVLRDGRTTIFVEGEVRNTDGELVAKATGTVRARPAEKG